jgi:hypothetical protein
VLATVALSFTSLQALAELCGFTGWLSWAWPVCLDAVAYLSTRTWLAKGPAWRFARGLAVGAIALSLVANGLVHALTEYRMAPHWMVVVLVGAVPPLMLALVVHMLVADRPTAVGTAEPTAVTVTDRSGERVGPVTDRPLPVFEPVTDEARPVDEPPVAETDRPEATDEPVRPAADRHRTGFDRAERAARTDTDLLGELRALATRTGGRPSVTAVRTGLRVGTDRARRLLVELDRSGLHVVGGDR